MRLLFTVFFLFLIQSLSAQLSPDRSFQVVNSLYDEQNPVISRDGSTLFFTVGNHPQNIGGKKDPGDIWFAQWIGGQWSAPIHGGTLLNDRAYNAVAGITSDGRHLFLHGHYDKSGTAKTQGISVSENSGQGWSQPSNIVIPYFSNKSRILSGSLSDDGSVFVFSAETYGTHGVDDIYVSIKTKGNWSEPKNLSSTINTQFQELSPSIGSDNKTLYFSSNGLKGSGSFDVFSSTRLDESWTNWSTPVNMGAKVNSSGRDLYFRIHPAQGYAVFTSTLNSDGYGDIKIYHPDKVFQKQDSAAIVVEEVKHDSVASITEMKHEIVDTSSHEKEVRVYGEVINSKTGEPVVAQIAFAAPGLGNQNTRSTTEGYGISISPIGQYTIFIEAQGYISVMEKLNIDTYEMQELEMNFSLQPVEIGTTVNLKNVLFAQTKADILPESYPELDLVVNFLKTNPNVRIELTGHTDNRGVHADNVKLSQQRVNKVKEYLIDKGIDSKRISGKGFGGTKPIASNDTEDSRRMNRRVEFTIKRF
jgi:outer membrane protein OmpA-like peptidoglycan-associated protein